MCIYILFTYYSQQILCADSRALCTRLVRENVDYFIFTFVSLSFTIGGLMKMFFCLFVFFSSSIHIFLLVAAFLFVINEREKKKKHKNQSIQFYENYYEQKCFETVLR